MSGQILTREEYAEALKRLLPAARKLADERRRNLTDADILAAALARWDKSAPVYGPCDLAARDHDFEALCETVDEPAWIVIGMVAKERGLA